jgi:hypothetical protein
MKPRDTELAGKGKTEYCYVMEIEIEYRDEITLLGITKERRHVINVKVDYTASNSVDAIAYMRADVAEDIKNGIDIISYQIVAFVEEEI